MDPTAVSLFEKVFQYGGVPAVVAAGGFYIIVKYLIPRLDRHLDILHQSLETQKIRAVSTDEKLVNIESKVELIHEHIIAPKTKPSWMAMQEREAERQSRARGLPPEAAT